MRLQLLVLCFGLLAKTAESAETADRIPSQRLLEGYAWPRGMSFRIADPESVVSGTLPALGTSQGVADSGPQPNVARRTRRSSARPVNDPVPRASSAPAAGPPAVDPERLRLTEMDLAVTQLRSAALDLAKLKVASRGKVALLPILLFLVERGVMTEAEKDAAMLDDADTGDLLARIADHVSRLASERDLLYVRHYLAGVARPAAPSK